MAPMMESIRSAPRIRTLGGALQFGRAALLVGWVVFALAAILSPCIQAIAAPASNIAPNAPETFTGTPVGKQSLSTERGNHGSESSCYDLGSAVPWNTQIPLTLATNYTPSGWDAIEGVATRPLIVSTRSGTLAQYEIRPPARSLYLRTLRLLI
jgi:hypothetical protein